MRKINQIIMHFFQQIRYNKNLKFGERLLFGEITALTNKEGYCYAKNKYFADLFDVSQSTISRWISHLTEINTIKVEIIRNEKKLDLEVWQEINRSKDIRENI